MELLSSIFNYILNDLGSTVFIPVLMMLLGLLFKMKAKDAISSGLLLGVAFTAVSLVSGYMGDIVCPLAKDMASTVGKEFTIVDGGWSVLASVTWTWKYAFIMFPIQILVNFIMLAFKKTDTLNVDLWNVWGKAFVAYLTIQVTGRFWCGLVVAILQMVLELILGDAMRGKVQEATGVEGITIPHRHMLLCSLLYPVDVIMRKVPLLNKELTMDDLKEKLGFLFDKHVFGFIIGFIFGLAAKQSIASCFTIGIKCGCALLLLPKVAGLFMEALNPFAEAASSYMQAKAQNRKIYIGLDNPMLMGHGEIWTTVILCIPVTLLLAVILPFNKILPFAALDNLTLAICCFMVTGGNLLRMIILYVLGTPIYLAAATFVGPVISQLGWANGVLEQGQMFASAGMDCPGYTLIFTNLFQFLQGNFIYLILACIFIAGYVFTVKGFKKEGDAYFASLEKKDD